MQIRKLLSTSPLHPIQMGFFILLELLLIFGDSFSKFHLFGPFHLYDTLLGILGLTAFFTIIYKKELFVNKVFTLFIGVSLIYLIVSIIFIKGPLEYTIRQYAIFIYPTLIYLIFFSYAGNHHKLNVRFIILMGLTAFIIQTGHHIYLSIRYSEMYKIFGTFNYFNKMAIMGVIVLGPVIMVYIKDKFLKILGVLLYLLMTMTLGHSSAFMSAFTILIVYLILRVRLTMKISILFISIVLVVIFYFYLPQFTDQNSQFRLVYWSRTLQTLVTNYYGILGHGFGVRLISDETIQTMNKIFNNPWMEVRPSEQYLTTMHNSFITYAFHIGLIPSLLFFVPLINPLKYYLIGYKKEETKGKDFLILSLVGVIVWASFNMVLELPHSSGFFWLIYFSVLYSFGAGKNYQPKF